MLQDYIDLDTQEKIRYVSESSNASTSGYSTMSPGPGCALSTPPSPSQSPSSALQTEFSNLNLPSGQSPQLQLQQQQQQNVYTPAFNYTRQNFIYHNEAPVGNVASPANAAMVTFPQYEIQQMYHSTSNTASAMPITTPNSKRCEYTAQLVILEQPVEKFRFRYKSEMHGTHGSLNGANSKRTPKTFPEVELRGFRGNAVIRCSLFQTTLDSPHSHQLVVRKDDRDICDPHDLYVSPDRGYIAQFQNMGIIHTAKKYIFEELLKKKIDRRRFEVGGDELSTKQKQEIHKETEREAKDMNLNQVRLCFEAFQVEENNTWTRIAAPVYTNPINNRKSAQTGELRICRLSIATGTVTGGDDLILLVEKVSKKNIKVRFYESNEEDGVVWEAFGKFRESDVHHQYAIVCQTPAYRNRDIDKPVEVFVELVRPSDDERSYPVTFRYKPRDVVISRKRRRTCSTATSSSGSGSSVSSEELPKTVRDTQLRDAQIASQTGNTMSIDSLDFNKIDKDAELMKILGSEDYKNCIFTNSEELAKLIPESELKLFAEMQEGGLEVDGTSSTSFSPHHRIAVKDPCNLQRILKICESVRNCKSVSETVLKRDAERIADVFMEHVEQYGETLINEIITSGNTKLGLKMCQILNYFNLNNLLNHVLNSRNESGLHCACLHDRVQYIRPLLALGCDPNIQNRSGDTAMHIAVKEQHEKCVDSFLNVKNVVLDLKLKNDDGFTAVHEAIRLKNYNITKKLLMYDANAALITNGKDGNNALHMAVCCQNINLVKFIIELKNSSDIVMARNAAGYTASNLAKSLSTKSGNDIFEFLSSRFTSHLNSNDYDGNLVIKEEEPSSSDDEDTMEEEQTEALELVKVKEEVNESWAKLEDLLNDQVIYSLMKLLNEDGKWKRMAELCKLQDRMSLWNKAEDFLGYVKTRMSSGDFISALKSVDQNAFSILQTTCK